MFQSKLFMLLLITAISPIFAQEDNVLIYSDPVQVTSEISPYANLTEDSPIIGTLMVTHDPSLKVDTDSFRMGKDSIKVHFIKEVPLSSQGNLVITIYQFELQGKKKGEHDLPAISVKVGEKEYQAPPLQINIDN